MPIENVPVGGTSLATVFIVGTAVLYGWPAATLVALLTQLIVESSRRRPLIRIGYNTSVYVLAAAAGGTRRRFAFEDEGFLALTVGRAARSHRVLRREPSSGRGHRRALGARALLRSAPARGAFDVRRLRDHGIGQPHARRALGAFPVSRRRARRPARSRSRCTSAPSTASSRRSASRSRIRSPASATTGTSRSGSSTISTRPTRARRCCRSASSTSTTSRTSTTATAIPWATACSRTSPRACDRTARRSASAATSSRSCFPAGGDEAPADRRGRSPTAWRCARTCAASTSRCPPASPSTRVRRRPRRARARRRRRPLPGEE